MTVSQLIGILQQCPGDAVVAYSDSEDSGVDCDILYVWLRKDGIVRLQELGEDWWAEKREVVWEAS